MVLIKGKFNIIYRIKEDMCLFVILFSEIESLRGRMTEKETEIETIRKS